MAKLPYRQCSRCVMDTSDAEIVFDERGWCNHCTAFVELRAQVARRVAEGPERLDKLISSIKVAGRSSDYDCVIGISGGVDSCYLVYLAKSLGLRPLAVHMDNGWDSDAAVQNVKSLVANLGIGYASVVLDWNEFRDLQVSFLKASVPEVETPTDIAIPAALHQLAAKHGVKTVVLGCNYDTEGILPRSWHYDAKDVKYLRAVHARFGTRPLRTFPTFGFRDEVYFKFAKGIRIQYLLTHVRYDRNEALELLRRDFGWKDYGGKHHESTFTAFVQSYLLPVKFDIDYRRPTFSAQICTGALSREQALTELEKLPYDATGIDRQKAYVAKKLGLSDSEFNEILTLPAKSSDDYPNNRVFLERMYRLYRRLRPAAE